MINCKITSYLNSNNTCDLTVAGVKRIAVTNFSRNHTFTTSVEDCFIDTISLDDDYFYPISFAEGSGYANSTVEQGGTADNKSLIHQVGFTLTSIDCNMISNWQSYLMGRLVFAVETKSGTVFIYGHKRGLRASQFDLNTGTAETDESGITALYEGKQASMPLVVKDWSIIEALYAPRPVNSISFDNDNYNITTTEGTAGEVGFRVYDNNGNDITDLCEITVVGQYVEVEGDEFVIGDNVSAGRYQTIATVTYQGKTATTTVYADVEEPHYYSQDYLTFEALESGTFTLTIPAAVDSTYMTSISYSTDNGSTWITTQVNATAQTITTPTISQGDKVLWKGTGIQMATFFTNGNYSVFSSTGDFNVCGNAMSLLYGDNFENQTELPSGSEYTFCSLFYNVANLVSTENLVLPATTLSINCYNSMFDSCTSLTTAPELPATTMAYGCYSGMFKKCSSLTSAPALTATTIDANCYRTMFAQCTSLTTAPALPATTLAPYCYELMFSICTSLTTAPALNATTLTDGCYRSMFGGCTSLTTAPELNATTLAHSCYMTMFDGCTSLNTIKMLATDISATNCLNNWVRNVASSGIFTKAASTTIPTGTSGIPANWTVISEINH